MAVAIAIAHSSIEPKLPSLLPPLSGMPVSSQPPHPPVWPWLLLSKLHTGRVESRQKLPKFPNCVEPIASILGVDQPGGRLAVDEILSRTARRSVSSIRPAVSSGEEYPGGLAVAGRRRDHQSPQGRDW
jgi:hypothetical protein